MSRSDQGGFATFATFVFRDASHQDPKGRPTICFEKTLPVEQLSRFREFWIVKPPMNYPSSIKLPGTPSLHEGVATKGASLVGSFPPSAETMFV